MTHTPLWTLVAKTCASALEAGDLQPIATSLQILEQDGLRFLLRRLEHHAVRAKAAGSRERTNPFLQPEPQLVVAELGPQHLGVLNKFPVVPRHLLIVTREFRPQETLLDPSDFAALQIPLLEADSLGFYNSGPLAGASQPHKHLQVVPLPLAPGETQLPLEPRWLDGGTAAPGPSPNLPFRHRLVHWSDRQFAQLTSESLQRTYMTMLRELELLSQDPPGPYNLLCTRRWMLVVPRAQPEFAGISLNSLAYVGAFFVQTLQQEQILRDQGCWAALRAGAFPQ